MSAAEQTHDDVEREPREEDGDTPLDEGGPSQQNEDNLADQPLGHMQD